MLQYCLYIWRQLLGKNATIQESIPICQLCSQKDFLIKLDCNHIICYGCLEMQQLYTTKPCFICECTNLSKLT